MELDDMKQAWQSLSRQLEQQQALHSRLWTESRLDKLRHGWRSLVWGQAIQIVIGVCVAMMAVSFWLPRAGNLHFLVWGLSLQAFGILMIATAARNLHLVHQIDYAAPVLAIQQRIATLRAWRVRVEAPLYAVAGSFVWIPLVLILIARAGVDPSMVAPALAGYLVLSGVVSLGLVALVAWLLRRAGHRRWLENNLAGASVRRAESMLAQIARFQQE